MACDAMVLGGGTPTWCCTCWCVYLHQLLVPAHVIVLVLPHGGAPGVRTASWWCVYLHLVRVLSSWLQLECVLHAYGHDGSFMPILLTAGHECRSHMGVRCTCMSFPWQQLILAGDVGGPQAVRGGPGWGSGWQGMVLLGGCRSAAGSD